MMNTPTVGNMQLVIVGATGMVGAYAIRYALDHPAVRRVTSIGRRKTGISHPKLDEILHQDFSDCSALAPVLSGQDAAVFCLGTYTGTGDRHRDAHDHRGLHGRVRTSSPRQQSRCGVLFSEREWR